MKVRQIVVVAALGIALWLGLDAAVHRRHSLRDFDPHAVARLETSTWRSYYDHRPIQLFIELTELLRTQYRLSIVDTLRAAFAAAAAAERFQPGHTQAEYARALPDLERFYALVRAGSDTTFDPATAARLELAWWIAHRECAQRPQPQPGHDAALEDALAALQAHIYNVPAARLADHARARSDAMLVRDAGAAAGGVSAADWDRIEGLLDRSWSAARAAIGAADTAGAGTAPS
jgi:hypothetical protein